MSLIANFPKHSLNQHCPVEIKNLIFLIFFMLADFSDRKYNIGICE